MIDQGQQPWNRDHQHGQQVNWRQGQCRQRTECHGSAIGAKA
jgi:hypothetical protein